MFKLSGIVKGFPRDGSPLPVLAGIDLEVARGELVSVLGPGGCGRTSLLNIIAGLIPPDSGEIQIDGRRLPGGRHSPGGGSERDRQRAVSHKMGMEPAPLSPVRGA